MKTINFILILIVISIVFSILVWFHEGNTHQTPSTPELIKEIQERPDWVLINEAQGLVVYYDYRTSKEKWGFIALWFFSVFLLGVLAVNEDRPPKKYIITQSRYDAIGFVQENLIKRMPDYEHIQIKSFKNIWISHLWESIRIFFIGLKIKEGDTVLVPNSKCMITHLLPYLTLANLYMIHFHFDDNELIIHKTPFFSYKKLLSQWNTIYATNHVRKVAEEKYGKFNATTIYFGIDHNIFKHWSIDRKNKNVLYVGSFHPRKNVFRMLEAFKLFHATNPDYRLVVVNGYGEGVPEFKAKVKELQLEKYIRYERNIPVGKLVSWYNISEAFVFPTHIEGFGLPLVEAMACGCPIVTTKGAVHEEITGGLETYVNPLEVEDIAKGISSAVKRKGNNVELAKTYDYDLAVEKIREYVENE